MVDSLQQKGIESYCPVKKVRRKWSDRIKTLEEPIFRSCVFVRIEADQKTTIRLTEGVVNFLYDKGKPAVVKGKDIEHLRKFLPDATEVVILEAEVPRQHRSFFTYLNGLQAWLLTCMERPKLA